MNMPQKSTQTKDKEKIAVWVDRRLLSGLRSLKKSVGIPVSEAINRAIEMYLKEQKK
ncbi:MAG: hypothetical protein DMG38_29925 [Acidobacteria bacterium]|nr:MAG: hypothetical protein DMG38_29925 [Acidobacteriota bacterium]